MTDLVSGVLEPDTTMTMEEIRHLLAEHHGIDRIEMEIAQPDRMDEVLAEMERRGIVAREGEGWMLLEEP